MASEKVSRKMVLEIKYVNANNAVIHTENLVTGILAKISLGTGIWAKFRLGTGIWYPPSRPSHVAQDIGSNDDWGELLISNRLLPLRRRQRTFKPVIL